MQSATQFDIATCMYYTGIDPFTKKEAHVAEGMRDRKMQWALMQFFKPEGWFAVREALIEDGCDCLIPTNPPKEAKEKRRREAQRAVVGDHHHTVANPAKGEEPRERGAALAKPTGYRPRRKSQRQRPGKNRHEDARIQPAPRSLRY